MDKTKLTLAITTIVLIELALFGLAYYWGLEKAENKFERKFIESLVDDGDFDYYVTEGNTTTHFEFVNKQDCIVACNRELNKQEENK